MQIFVRADSGTDIGTGHIMRCLALAKQLRKMSFCVEFISKKLDGNVTELVKKNGFKIHYLDKKITTKKSLNIDSEQTINKIIKNSKIPPFLIVDHYNLDIKWEKKLRGLKLYNLNLVQHLLIQKLFLEIFIIFLTIQIL